MSILYNISLLCILASVYCESVTVVTNKGSIIGSTKNGYSEFLGVPYAKVNESNPFGENIKYPNFEEPFNASSSSICPQVYFKDSGILQCLNLNIYVSTLASMTNLRPILVWFHGGGFTFGSGVEYGCQHLVQNDIIVITVNYRLGPYGFMCLDDPLVPGNQGLKDQITALRWIKQSIRAFGGNPSKVTIAGESYGGGAVDLHFYSNYETLFHQAIIQSGSAFVPGLYVKPDRNQGVKLANILGHNVTDNEDAIRVLAKEDPANVMSASRKGNLTYGVCKEKCYKGVKNFVTDHPFSLSNCKRVKHMPVLFGYNSQELIGEFANKGQDYFKNVDDIFYHEMNNLLNLDDVDLRRLALEWRLKYLGAEQIGLEYEEYVIEMADFLSDIRVNNPAERSVKNLVEQGAKVYKYLFSFTQGSWFANITGAGAPHTEELKYLFDWGSKLNGTEQEMMRKKMTTMWANFVKFGNPIPASTVLLPVTWRPYKLKTKSYLDIDIDLSIEEDMFAERMRSWDEFWRIYETKSVVYDETTCREKYLMSPASCPL